MTIHRVRFVYKCQLTIILVVGKSLLIIIFIKKDEANIKEVNDFWQDVEKERNIKEYETIIENLDMAFTVERTLEHNDYVREVGERRRQVMKRTSENCEDMNNLEQVKRTSKKKYDPKKAC